MHHLHHHHSPGLMVLSVAIAIMGSYVSLAMLRRAHRQASVRSWWLVLAALIFGSGVWSMHFTAMLAFQVPFAVTYDWFLTAMSVVLAWGFVGLGLAITVLWRHWLRTVIAGVLMGIGVAGMHYTGMAALRMPATLNYAPWSVLAAVVVGIAASILALIVAQSPKLVNKAFLWQLVAALLGGIAVSGLHYLAMMGTEVVFNPALAAETGAMSANTLATAVVVATGGLLGGSLLLAKMDEQTEQQQSLESSLNQLQVRQTLLRQSVKAAEMEIDDRGLFVAANESALALLGATEVPRGQQFLSYVSVENRPAVEEFWVRLQREDGRQGALSLVLPGINGRRLTVNAAPVDTGGERRWLFITHIDPGQANECDIETGLPLRHVVLAWRAPEPALAVRCSVPMLDSLAQLLQPELFRRLLQTLLDTLQAALADSQLLCLARVSSSDFLLILSCDGAQPNRIAQRLTHLARLPLWLDERPWHVAMRFGLAELETGSGGERALRCTSAALRRAEQERMPLHIYHVSMDQEWQDQIQLEQELRFALSGNQFNLLFQPKLDLRSDRICGVEALLRWHSPTFGAVAPDIFIPMLESTGNVVEVGDWIIDQCLRQLQHFSRLPELAGLSMAINVSPLQLGDENFVANLERRRRTYGLEAGRIELEITEGIAMDRSEHNMSVLATLRAAGYRLAIDDFGTGYSSLAYLRHLPMDTLKIDRNFIRDIDRDAKARQLVDLMVQIGHALGYQVVAEGVESEAQLALLRASGVDVIQGYLVARPLPPDRLEACALSFAGPVDTAKVYRWA